MHFETIIRYAYLILKFIYVYGDLATGTLNVWTHTQEAGRRAPHCWQLLSLCGEVLCNHFYHCFLMCCLCGPNLWVQIPPLFLSWLTQAFILHWEAHQPSLPSRTASFQTGFKEAYRFQCHPCRGPSSWLKCHSRRAMEQRCLGPGLWCLIPQLSNLRRFRTTWEMGLWPCLEGII